MGAGEGENRERVIADAVQGSVHVAAGIHSADARDTVEDGRVSGDVYGDVAVVSGIEGNVSEVCDDDGATGAGDDCDCEAGSEEEGVGGTGH